MKKTFFFLLFIILAAGIFLGLSHKNLWFFRFGWKPQNTLIQSNKTYKIGVIFTGGAYQQAFDGLKKGLEEKGFQEGKNIFFIIKDTRGAAEALAPSARELMSENPDVIYSISTPVTTQVSKIDGDKIPVVFNIVGDPIGAGFSKNYALPGTNLTGCSNLSAELSGKRLEFFKEAFPNIKKVVTFYDPDNKFSQIASEDLRNAARVLNIQIDEVFVKNRSDLETALSGISSGQIDGIYITPDAMVVSNAELVVKRSLDLKIPTMGHEQTMAEKGVTLTYGANFFNMGVECSSIVANILSGQEPETTPILTPDKFDIVVNQNNLSTLGISIESKIPKSADVIIR